MATTVEINDANFDELVKNTDQLVMIDFWAEWCGPCKMLTPIVEELAGDYEGKALIGKVNVDENMMVSSTYGIRNIPTLLFFKNGEVVDKQVGYVPKSVLAQKLESNL
ncbi:MAG: thioredoxin [Microscillaceae bacterium]|nr:thioredoxin [Microscillaceae bacterium]